MKNICPAILKTVHSTVAEIANLFNRPQRGNENRHDWRIPHNTPYNNYSNWVVCRYIKLFFHSEQPREFSWKKKSSNDKVASAHLFTIVCSPPRLFTKGFEVTLEDKLINPID